MARPKKNESEMRTEIISVRLTKAEMAKVDDCCQRLGVSRSYFALKRLLGQRIQPAHSPVDREAVRQLIGIGNNLNQIARVLNSRGSPDAQEVQATLAEVRELLAVLREGR